MVASRTNLYAIGFGGPWGGREEVGELAARTPVLVTAAGEDADGDRWVVVASDVAEPLGRVDPADLQSR